MNDRDVLDCQGEGEWTIEACWTCRVCWTCQGVGGFGVRMNMSMGVSERGRVDDRDVLDVSERGMLRSGHEHVYGRAGAQ